ncbi:phage portal protein [Oscillibacter sp. MSJ-31]|uniref:phage portal protein n=1 Tax=Oscillibacter sp. MSJ-31 TaxID=2841526 RepID=UPI001C12745B|nr:phage portal protein [Oscillibacter sp. MSJ-31]MBU5458641.1 phage portal protein [Oscillibacter sp. MSJ-31]
MKQDIICARAPDAEALGAAVGEFLRTVRPERQRLFDYYHGEQTVNKGETVRGRPDNRLRAPFPRYITEVHTGYFLGLSPTLAYGDAAAGGRYAELSRALDLPHLYFDLGRDLSICGAGFALVWAERSGVRVCRCDPCDCFAIRSGDAGAPLLAAVRLFAGGKGETRGVLYTAERLIPFVWDRTGVTLGTAEENLLHTIPLLPFYNNCQGVGDFEMVTGLVDAYNLLLSGALDDMQSVDNAFLALYGMQGTTQKDIEQANRTRILVLSEGGRAEFVVKNLNHEALGQLEANLRRSILQLSMTPDLGDEHFAGNSSGVALQYKLWGIEQVRSAKERSFTVGLRSLLGVLSAGERLMGRGVALSGGELTFYKNLPQGNTALASTLLSLAPVLSQQTILENLPWVSDAQEELRRKAAEAANAKQ